QEAKLRSFGLVECKEDGYPARTLQNVIHSDGTLLIGDRIGGTLLTHKIATELKKPIFRVDLLEASGAKVDSARVHEFRSWLSTNQIKVLNVAGNRESEAPGIAEFTRSFLLNALGQRGARSSKQRNRRGHRRCE